jgi:PAS domain S-box-containing protein
MDYKERYNDLLETNKQLEKEIDLYRSIIQVKNDLASDMVFRVFHSASYLMAINKLDSGQYVDVNSSFINALGYSKEEILGHTPDDIQIFTDFEESNKYMKLISKLKKIKDYPITLRTKSGEEKPYLFSAETVLLEDENFLLTIYDEISTSNDRMIKESQGSVLDEIFETTSSYLTLFRVGDDNRFYIIDLNSQVEEVEFIKKSDVLGKCIDDTPLVNQVKLLELLHYLRITGNAHKLAASPKGDDSEGYYMGFILTSGNIIITWEPGHHQKNLVDLNKQEAVFKKFAEMLTEMIYEVDLTGKVLYCNQHGLKFSGYTEEDITKGLKLSDLFPENYKKTIENLKALKAPCHTFDNEIFIRRKNGDIVPTLTHSFAKFHNEKKIGYRGVVTDIRRQKECEKQINRDKAFLENLIDSTTEAIAIIDISGKISTINKEFTNLFGYTSNEAVNRFIDDLIVPDDLKEEALILDLNTKLHHKEIRQTIRKNKDGKKIHVSLIATTIVVNNEIVAFVGIYRDITSERKNQLLQEILYNISSTALKEYDVKEIYPVIVQELSKIWDTNNFFIALYDKSSETLSLPFFADEKDNFYEIPTKNTITGWVINNNKSVLLRLNDLKLLEESGEIDLIGTPCKVWMGVPLRVKSDTIGVMCLQDYHHEDKFSNHDLYVMELIANQIAIALKLRMMLDSLILARQKAEEAAQTKQLFMSTMSHEIRTPLNEVIGITNLLLQGNPNDDQMDFIKTLKFSGNHLLTLVNDVLDYNKMESGKIVFEQTQFNLSDFLDEIVRSYSFRSKAKNLTFEIKKTGNIPDEVIGDPIRLNQILSNLLSNALKFTKTGGITVIIKELKRTKNQSEMEFAITDTGIGIPKDKQSVIFESFTQASPDTTRHFGGTGLGLAICKKLIELQGGTISVESEPGKGSTFRFIVSIDVAETGSLGHNPKFSEDYSGMEGKRILVAEDNKINFFVANKFLAGWGVSVTHAENGQTALDMLEKESFDLILMDLHMPVLDGIEAIRIIRKSNNPKISNIPIVALTAAIMSESPDKLDDLRINDYVLKPFKPHDLFERILRNIK